jgi:phosphatidylinositol alpha 1,6-mannosyltransferase
MRVALVSESFLPQVNGVTNTVRHVVDRLVATGHQALVVAPGPGPDHYGPTPVVRVRSATLPGYRSFALGLPDRHVGTALAGVRPHLVHLASPVSLGACGLRAARRLGVPTLAVYQTDLAGFARRYGVPVGGLLDAWVGGLHRRADRTLVPSSASRAQLAALGVGDLHLWGRGVELALFDPRHRSDDLHARWAAGPGTGERVVVGYVGRLAAEKNLHRLVEVSRIPGVDVVVVGDGPLRSRLERLLPAATFAGMLRGRELAEAFASLDVFVHPGEDETFCQTVQEAQASGVPVVAAGAGGPLDLVEHGVTGLLYGPADPRSLRRSVARLVGDPLLRRTLGRAGRVAVQGRTWESLVDRLVTDHYLPLALPSVPVGPARPRRAA